MRNIKLDNNDIVEYLNTIEELKKHPSMDEYIEGYNKLNNKYEIKKYSSAHTELRRLDRKRQSLFICFIEELNPISFSASIRSGKKFEDSIIYRKALLEKNPDEIIALVVKKRTEAALDFQQSVEKSLEQLSDISFLVNGYALTNTKRRKMTV